MVAALTQTLEDISAGGGEETIRIDDIVHALSKRGFGALILGPAVLIVLPTGAIPGVPAVCGLLIVLLAGQMVLGREKPWLPKKLTRFGMERRHYDAAVEKVRPFTRWIDGFFKRRLEVLTQPVAQRVIALLCVALSLVIVVAGFVPFLAAAFAAPMVFFGLSLIAHDGLLAGIGLVLVLAVTAAVPMLL